MSMQQRYASMVDRLKPIAMPHMTQQQRATADACVDAGEAYEAMLDLMWVAAKHHAPSAVIADAFNLLDDEDREDYVDLLA